MAPRLKATGLIVLAVFAVTAVASAGRTAGPPGFTLSGSIKSKVAKKQTLNFVLSIEGTGIPIFGPAMADGWKKGVSEVQAQYGAKIHGQVIGPVNTDIAGSLFQSSITPFTAPGTGLWP